MAINPLNEQHLQGMKESVSQTPEIVEYLRKCNDCGLDATSRIEVCKAQDEFCRKVLQNFFPEHATG